MLAALAAVIGVALVRSFIRADRVFFEIAADQARYTAPVGQVPFHPVELESRNGTLTARRFPWVGLRPASGNGMELFARPGYWWSTVSASEAQGSEARREFESNTFHFLGFRYGDVETGHFIGIPYWLPLVAISCVAALLARRWLHRAAATDACPKCGYDTRGTPGRCPECGWSASSG